jgi:hypothetical protein
VCREEPNSVAFDRRDLITVDEALPSRQLRLNLGVQCRRIVHVDVKQREPGGVQQAKQTHLMGCLLGTACLFITRSVMSGARSPARKLP